MSRRKLLHGKAARIVVMTKGGTNGEKLIPHAERGNVEQWRAERGIVPHGKRVKNANS